MITQRKSHWRETFLICRKCSKKLHGGFGENGKKRLFKLLQKKLDLKKGRRASVGIIEVSCFDICPKKAVTVALGSAPQVCHVIPKGTPVETVIETFRLAPQPHDD